MKWIKRKREWTRGDLIVGPDIECVTENIVIAYIETWFDVDEKFGTKTADDDGSWVNLYAEYNLPKHKLKMIYILSTDTSERVRRYWPTRTEKKLIIGLMEETCQVYHKCSLKQYLEEAFQDLTQI